MSISPSNGIMPRAAGNWNGELTDLSGQFDQGVADLNLKLKEALEELQKNPGKPENLAAYQAALSEYNLYRNAQSNVVKVYKDIDAAIIQNFR
ncbi:type III secretion system major needle protein (YscF/MxiH/PrgI family) [Iodobacter fluviatilis]|uniref:Type III secretion system major needle protein (YscF/MxiH/PrgI family) n=2 Tax=Iodobacter fluviatilis TaxID=537 RepID=A0A377Q5P1_9NEIS|nr:type III secretion system major needle protein (YscF/MxiH/PrgI family) [Iodobacter fluviatilis]STQ90243.1 type III secretion system needle complex protein PrgI [Iodobacter fluviatilis]